MKYDTAGSKMQSVQKRDKRAPTLAREQLVEFGPQKLVTAKQFAVLKATRQGSLASLEGLLGADALRDTLLRLASKGLISRRPNGTGSLRNKALVEWAVMVPSFCVRCEREHFLPKCGCSGVDPDSFRSLETMNLYRRKGGR